MYIGAARVEPLAGQPVAVQGEHTVEEGVPLLDRQGPVLAVDQTQLIVQTCVRGARAREQRREGRDQRDQHPTECLHVLPSCVVRPALGPTVFPWPWSVAKPHTSQDVHVSGIRNLTWCSYVLLIVDSRNITGRHPPGNAYALSLGAVSVVESSLLPRRQAVPGTAPAELPRMGDGPGPAHRGDRRMCGGTWRFPTSNGKSKLSHGAAGRCPATNALARLRRRMRRRRVRRQWCLELHRRKFR